MKRTLQLAAFAAPTLMLLLIYGADSYREPVVTTPIFFFLLAAVIAAACLGTGERQPTAPARSLWARSPESWWIRAGALLAGGLLYVLLSPRPYQGMVLYPEFTRPLYAATGAAAGLLGLLLVRPPRPLASLVLLLAAGLGVRAAGLLQWDIDPARRDMLPLVLSAIERFLAGENPYAFHQMQTGSEVPLTYPPGLWLAHLPAYLAGLDIRWTAWVADAAIVLGLGWAAVKHGSARTAGPVFLALAAYLFLPDVHWNGLHAEPQVDWALAAAMAAAALAGRPFWLGGLYGVALTIRPFNVVFFPFLVIWLIRRHGLVAAWRALLLAGCVAAAVYLPFVLPDPDAFYVGTVRWLLEYGPAHRTWFYGMLGWSGLLYERDLDAWMPALQAGTVALAAGLAAWRMRSLPGFLAFFAAAYALFVSFNPIIWMSFWIPVCLLAAALVSAAGASRDRAIEPVPRPPLRRNRLALDIALTAVVAAALGLLVALLARHFSDAGREEAEAYIASEAARDDLILDRTGWRKAFLEMPYLFEGRAIPAGARLASDPFSAALPRPGAIDPLGSRRIWAVERFGLFRRFAGLYLGERGVSAGASGIYALSRLKQFGRFTVALLERPGRSGQPFLLSDRPDQLAVRVRFPGGRDQAARWMGDSWRWGGRSGWEYVAKRVCPFERIGHPMLFAHPWPDAALEIGASGPRGPGWITLFGGLVDRSPLWGASPVEVTVSAGPDRREVGRYRFDNAPGIQGTSFESASDLSDLRFAVTAGDVRRRNFCFDAIVSPAR